MKKKYDFSKAEKNPYYDKIKKQGCEITPDVSFSIDDILNFIVNSESKTKNKKSQNLLKTIKDLQKRVKALEKKIDKRP